MSNKIMFYCSYSQIKSYHKLYGKFKKKILVGLYKNIKSLCCSIYTNGNQKTVKSP